MSSDDDKRPAPFLPPPPTPGGPKPPEIAPPKVEAKAEARSVGIDTMFIDGLTEGLADELPEPIVASSEKSGSSSARSGVIGEPSAEASENEEPALPAFDDEGIVGNGADDEDAEDADEPSENAPTLFFDPGVTNEEKPRAEEKVAAAPPPHAAASIPRTWWLAGGALAVFVVALAFRGSGDDAEQAATSDAVAQRGESPDGSPGEADAAAEGGGAAADDPANAGGGVEKAGGDGDDGEAPGAAEEGQAGGETDPNDADEAAAAQAADTDAAAAGAAEGEAEDVVEVVEEDGGDGSEAAEKRSRSGGSSLPPGKQDPSRAAEDGMSAEELLAAAKDAYKSRKYRDAYRLANQSNRKKASDDALELKAKAACGMKDKDLAKSSFKKLPLGDRRREVRDTCRTHDIRIGI